jgi:hypothetical protein
MVFTCIITGCEPEDPVYCVDDGQTYERDAIVRYLNEYRHTGRTPVGSPIVLGRLIPNNVIKMKYTRCPLSNNEIRNPIIVANDGHTYDKDALVNEFRRTICIGEPITLPSGICTYTLDMYHNFAFNDMINSNQTVNNSNLIRNHRSDTIDLFRFNDIADNWVINGDIHRRIKFDILRELRTIEQSNSVFNKKFISCNIVINGKYIECTFTNCIVRRITSRSVLSNCVFRNCVFKYCDFTAVSIRSTCIMINCIQRNTFGIDSRIMSNEIVWVRQ